MLPNEQAVEPGCEALMLFQFVVLREIFIKPALDNGKSLHTLIFMNRVIPQFLGMLSSRHEHLYPF